MSTSVDDFTTNSETSYLPTMPEVINYENSLPVRKTEVLYTTKWLTSYCTTRTIGDPLTLTFSPQIRHSYLVDIVEFVFFILGLSDGDITVSSSQITWCIATFFCPQRCWTSHGQTSCTTPMPVIPVKPQTICYHDSCAQSSVKIATELRAV